MDTETMHAWERAIPGMIKRLATKAANRQTREDPWMRAATNMVAMWNVRLGTPPAPRRARRRKRETWLEFARLATDIARRKWRRNRMSDWHAWASRRVTPSRRYLRKSRRPAGGAP